MLSNWFSSLYRIFLVLSESLQVWSCTGWEMDQLEQMRQKRLQFGDFHAEQSWWLFPIVRNLFQRQRFLRKLQVISGFALISIFLLQPHVASKYLFFFPFLYIFSTLFSTQNQTLKLHCWDLLTCKGRRLHLSRLQKITLNQLFLSVILMQYYSVLMFVFSCVMAE